MKYERIIFTKKDFLISPSKLLNLKVISNIPKDGNDFSYNSTNGIFYQGTVPISLTNKDYFENKSLTLSYSIETGRWSSWHNYLPNVFIMSKNSLYSYITGSNSIWKHNQIGSYGNFYGVQYPFIIERVTIANPLRDNMYEDMIIQSDARRWDGTNKEFVDERFITFNKILLYNKTQSSGELQLIVKQSQPNPAKWYEQQIINEIGKILINKKGEDWTINNFRDYVVNYNVSLFSSKWEDIKEKYFIDKVVNIDSVQSDKNWSELRNFSGKFIVIRLTFDNFIGINLGLNYSIDTQQIIE